MQMFEESTNEDKNLQGRQNIPGFAQWDLVFGTIWLHMLLRRIRKEKRPQERTETTNGKECKRKQRQRRKENDF
jgi:hypothetical protein